MKWKVVNVPADGNCLFSALALQLERSGTTAAHDIRMELVENMRSNPIQVKYPTIHLL
jgi:hypothetical protein